MRGVAISTTGQEHRLGFLETAVKHWDRAVGSSGSVFVTVDGSEADVERVHKVVGKYTYGIVRVGQRYANASPFAGRLGVAVNKNTGLELLMNAGVEHLFLSDDDTWPLFAESLDKHIDFDYPHSMVCWGAHRLEQVVLNARWNWPRGVMLYQHRVVVETVGGMVEAFGLGGHEHAEYSRRIHQHGFTPAPFISPSSYATRNAMGAGALWHCEDMRGPHETPSAFLSRKRRLTTINANRNWGNINRVMESQDGSTAFVPYAAKENGRGSATLCPSLLGRGAGGDK